MLSDLRLDTQLCKDVQQAQLLQRTAELLPICTAVALRGEGQDIPCDELRSMLAVIASGWQQPLLKGYRDLYLEQMHCPRAVMQQPPVGMTMLTFK
jgi:hypothetical protein